MKSKRVKDSNIVFSFTLMLVSGIGMLTLSLGIVPAYKKLLDISSGGAQWDYYATASVILLSVFGLVTVILSLIYQLYKKRIIEYFYER